MSPKSSPFLRATCQWFVAIVAARHGVAAVPADTSFSGNRQKLQDLVGGIRNRRNWPHDLPVPFSKHGFKVQMFAEIVKFVAPIWKGSPSLLERLTWKLIYTGSMKLTVKLSIMISHVYWTLLNNHTKKNIIVLDSKLNYQVPSSLTPSTEIYKKRIKLQRRVTRVCTPSSDHRHSKTSAWFLMWAENVRLIFVGREQQNTQL